MTSTGVCKPALALLALLALAGCGSSSGSSTGASGSVSQPSGSATTSTSKPTSPSGVSSGGAVHVAIKGLAFHPAAINVKVGDQVVFLNQDTPVHNVTWVSGPKFTSSSTLATGAKFTLTASQPGTIHYFCSLHPFMKGTILVTK
jgi:plastocyanin